MYTLFVFVKQVSVASLLEGEKLLAAEIKHKLSFLILLQRPNPKRVLLLVCQFVKILVYIIKSIRVSHVANYFDLITVNSIGISISLYFKFGSEV